MYAQLNGSYLLEIANFRANLFPRLWICPLQKNHEFDVPGFYPAPAKWGSAFASLTGWELHSAVAKPARIVQRPAFALCLPLANPCLCDGEKKISLISTTMLTVLCWVASILICLVSQVAKYGKTFGQEWKLYLRKMKALMMMRCCW